MLTARAASATCTYPLQMIICASRSARPSHSMVCNQQTPRWSPRRSVRRGALGASCGSSISTSFRGWPAFVTRRSKTMRETELPRYEDDFRAALDLKCGLVYLCRDAIQADGEIARFDAIRRALSQLGPTGDEDGIHAPAVAAA